MIDRLRFASWVILVIALAAPLLAAASWASSDAVIDATDNGASVFYTASHHLVLPGGCATLRWQVQGVEHLALDDQPVALRGEREVCPDASTGYTLSYLSRTGGPARYSLFVRVLFTTANTRLLGGVYVLCVALVVFSVGLFGDLPVISRWLLPLRGRVAPAIAARARGVAAAVRPATTRRDLAHLTALALIAALPLILLRFTSWIAPSRVALPVILVWLVVLYRWIQPARAIWRTRRSASSAAQPGATRFARLLGASALLLVCTIVGFYIPMLDQFWMGGDEIYVLENAARGWSSIPLLDEAQGRPLTPLAAIVAARLTPQDIDGFLWLAGALRFLDAALIYGIVRLLLPRQDLVALAAAVLFIVNPSEPTRFLAVYMQGYNALTFLLLLALYLYLRSGRANNRLMLALSCVALGAGLLMSEPGYSLALMWPVLAWLALDRQRRPTWIYAWAVTVGLFATRFVLYQLTAEETYQQNLVGNAFAPEDWIAQFVRQLVAILRYGVVYDASTGDWLTGLALGALVAAGLLALAQTSRPPETHTLTDRRYANGLLLALAATVLGFLPFVTITGLLGEVRTQFLSAPGQAIFLAVGIGWLARFFAPRWRGLWVAAAAGLLVTLPTVSAPNEQAHRPINPEVKYEYTACIARQILEQAPAVRPDTVLLFLQDDDRESWLGWNYHGFDLANYLLGVEGYPIEYTDSLGVLYTLDPEVPDATLALDYPFDRYVAFEIGADRSVTLLEELPASILPRELPDGGPYNPHARILPGEPRQPRFLRCQA